MPATTATNSSTLPVVSRRVLLGGIAGTLALRAISSPRASASFQREKPAPALEIMTDILQQLPGSLAAMDEPGILFTYVDIAAQLKALDIPAFDPDKPDALPAYLNATTPLPLGEIDLFTWAMNEEFITGIGFHPMSATQAMRVGAPGAGTMLVRGGFDPKTVVKAWEKAGYEQVTTASGSDAWTIGPDGTFSPDVPLQRMAVGAVNNVTILDSEWLIFTRTLDLLDEIVSFADATTADSLFAAPGVRESIANLHDETVAVIAVDGALLSPEQTFPTDSPMPDGILTETMPAATLLTMAVTGGIHALDAASDVSELADVVVQARLVLESAKDAKLATEVVAARWETLDSMQANRPYTTFLEMDDATTVDTVAALDFSITGSPTFWYQFLYTRDWLPFVATAGS